MKCLKQLTSFVLLATLAACGGDSTGPGDDDGDGLGRRGLLRFTYSGGGEAAGTFQAEGAIPASGTLGTWAGGGRIDDSEGITVLITAVTRSGAEYDMMSIELDGATTGTYDFGSECEVKCAYGAVAFGVASWTDAADRACTVDEGEIIVTSLSGTEAKGTFSGAGSCMTDEMEEDPFRVTAGSFDLPLVDLQG